MNYAGVKDIGVAGKRVLVRVDFNVPLDKGQVTDDLRLRAALRTINYLRGARARVILLSHLGRPDGQVKPEFSLRPVQAALAALLDAPVAFVPDCVGSIVEQAVAELEESQVLLLENLRFHPEEEKNNPEFAALLARLGDVYVNDAFGCAHRAHASTQALPQCMPVVAAGFLMEKELHFLGQSLQEPQRPFTAVLGGAKISGKIDVIQNLFDRVDNILIGGGMMYTFLKAQGYEIGASILEKDRVEMSQEILRQAQKRQVKLELPVDTLVAESLDATTVKICPVTEIPAGWFGVDIGPATIEHYGSIIRHSRTLLWNGPMGIFEKKQFASGTFAMAEAAAEMTAAGGISIIGGGDSAAAVLQSGQADRITHISTGGGASLEFLEGKKLPGVEALKRPW
ncbi:phosphoglycerate kinase [bacterium]|nr:phosphoglycerate kinase [bacterium]